jgi:L-2-hydroxyglutarate oxidase LhgO
LHEVEPHAAGIQALHVPETGIVDYSLVCRRLAELVTQSRGRVHTNARVVEIRRESGRFVLETPARRFLARTVVNCAGLHSDRVTTMSGQKPTARIVPFRGEYYELTAEARPLCRNLIYPVPDPQFPFLGVHFTRMIGGGVECGPNAVLAFAREGYRKTDVNLRDLWSIVSYGGFLRLAVRHFRMGVGEMVRSCFKRAFVTALQRLVPEIQPQHLVPGKAGVRAQAVAADGKMVDDFLIQQNGAMINVGNAPSPAATSALNIGDLIVDKLPRAPD